MKKTKHYLGLFALGVTFASMYNLPYIKYIFYDALIEGMGVTNQQLGALLSYYALACIITYIPGGWLADRVSPKKILSVCSFFNGLLCIYFAFTLQSYNSAILVWILAALTGSAAFWAAIMKAVRISAPSEEQGTTFGIFEAMCGLASTLGNFLLLFIFSRFASTDVGLKAAIIGMGVLSIIGAVLIVWLYDDQMEDNTGEVRKKASFQDVINLLKKPGVYLSAIVVFSVYSIYSGQTYLTPYFSNVLGASVVFSGSLAVVRTYGLKLIGGPVGGIVGDKIGSVSKMIAGSALVCLIFLVVFLKMPASSSIVGLLTALMLILATVNFMMKGTMFATIDEVGISPEVTGLAVGLISLVGYLPDAFMHTMFGNWLDVYGNTGYQYIFTYLAGMCVTAFVATMLITRMKRKMLRQTRKVWKTLRNAANNL
ncbi:MFS transporter [Clostridia bacterium]|nr:MFS transporter [Clostridia bacterium]